MIVSLAPEKDRVWITPTPAPQPTPSATDITNLLDQAQKLEKVQKRLEALRLYLAVLRLEPQNKAAAIAVAHIQDEVLNMLVQRLGYSLETRDVEASRSVLSQIEKLTPTDKRIADWQKQIDALSKP